MPLVFLANNFLEQNVVEQHSHDMTCICRDDDVGVVAIRKKKQLFCKPTQNDFYFNNHKF